MKILLPALLALAFPLAVGAAPANPAITFKKVALKISVDPKAHALFARAAALYEITPSKKNLSALRVTWKTSARSTGEPDINSKSSLEIAADGSLRLQTPDDYISLVVGDGKEMWSKIYALDEKGRTEWIHEAVDPETAYLAALNRMQFSTVMAQTFHDLLSGFNPLDKGRIQRNMLDYQLTEVRAIVLPAQPFGGQACDIVRVTKISPNDSTPGGGITTQQLTYWLARADGRLMRLQTKTTAGQDISDTGDDQITEQQLNPTFDRKLFRFVRPANAIVEERN